jgi:hypothetical protein
MVVLPIRSRTVPVETDDAYTYIIKAAEMQDCFLQDCPALNDLRQQLTAPAEKPETTWIRYREYVRAFTLYHPLHSLILISLNMTGLPWEVSYNFVEIAGSLFLSLAISYWLYRLFGSGPAGIALLLLAFTPFPKQGLHYVVPSNLALGIAMFAWGSLLKRSNRSHWIMIGSTLALVSMHPIGRLYALLGVFLFVLLNFKQMKRADWLVSGFSILVVVITFFLPLLVTRPELSILADPAPVDWNIWLGYRANITGALDFIIPWMDLYGGILMAVLFLFVGLASLHTIERRTQVASMAVLLGGLLCASLLQVLPRYPAEAFGRIWIPSAIFSTGFIAHGIWRWAVAVIHRSRQLLQNGFQDFRDEGWISSKTGWAWVFLLSFGLVLARNSVNNVIEGQRMLHDTLKITIDSQNSRLDAEQPSILLRAGCKDILYMFEVPMHLYFAHGALACGAIYYPGLADSVDEINWIQNNRDLGYVVTWNPTIKAAITTGGNPLTLETGDYLEFHLPEGWGSQQVYVYLENPGGNIRLDIFSLQVASGKKHKASGSIPIPANWSGWQVIDVTADELARGFRLEADQVSEAIFLRGIKSEPDSSRNWPWDQGVTLIHQWSRQNAAEINFNTADLVPFSNRSLTVLDDQGDTVLIKVNP